MSVTLVEGNGLEPIFNNADIQTKEMSAVLWLLDGTTTMLKMQIPLLTTCADSIEAARFYMESYILSMTRYFWQIKAYQLSTPWNTWATKVEIPEGKIYVTNPDSMRSIGEWKNTEDIPKFSINENCHLSIKN